MARFLILAATLFLGFAMPRAQAQEVLGFRLGLNLAGIESDQAGDFGNRTGFVGGLLGTFPLRYGLALQPEILYAQKGFLNDDAVIVDVDSPPLAVRVELTYLEVPVLVKYNFEVGRSSAFAVYAGPAVSFELAERIIIDGLEGSQSSDRFHSPDVIFAAGVDFEADLLGTTGLIGARFSRSVMNAREQTGSMQGPNVYNRALSLFVGLHLR